MNQQTIQILNVTQEEFSKMIQSAVGPIKAQPTNSGPSLIRILNKKDSAKTLCISETLFDKLAGRGVIPSTVHAGFNKDGKIINRWAEHHLIAIKPVVQSLKFHQCDADYEDARNQIEQILGL